jgi:urea transport system permease protein
LFPEAWLFALGGLFVFVTLFLPKGIIGLLDKFSSTKRKEKDTVLAKEEVPTNEKITMEEQA